MHFRKGAFSLSSLPCCERKSAEVLKIIDELGADVLSCYITAIDICFCASRKETD